MTNYYEQIRAACIKVNPSILDLVMGCEIKNESWFIFTIVRKTYWGWEAKWGNELIDFRENNFEIIWRPITLQDVLFARLQQLDARGLLLDFTEELYDWYDLSKPLSEQSWQFYKWCAEQLWYEEWRTLEQALTPENIERAVKESTQDYEDFLREKWII